MPNYVVRSGQLEYDTDTDCPENAAVMAVSKWNKERQDLGRFVAVENGKPEETLFIDTQTLFDKITGPKVQQ